MCRPPSATRFREVCEATPEVEPAWVCLVERSKPGREAEERLRFAVKLQGRFHTSEDGFAGARLLVSRLSEPQGELIAQLGLAVLADRAAVAAKALALRSASFPPLTGTGETLLPLHAPC